MDFAFSCAEVYAYVYVYVYVYACCADLTSPPWVLERFPYFPLLCSSFGGDTSLWFPRLLRTLFAVLSGCEGCFAPEVWWIGGSLFIYASSSGVSFWP